MSPVAIFSHAYHLIRLFVTVALLVMLLVLALLASGCAEGERNALKDRMTVPPVYEPMSVRQMVSFEPRIAHEPNAGNRHAWSARGAAEVDAWEKRAVCVQAYAVDMHYNPFDGDLTLNLAERPTDDASNSMYAEATRGFQHQQSDWSNRSFGRLVKDRAQVRVSGWLFYDDFHDKIGRAHV